MRSWLFFLAFACSAPEGARGSEPFPEDGSIARLEISLGKESVERLKKRRRKWVEGALTYSGETYEKVAIRLKGHRSMQRIDKKPAFKIHFTKYVEKRRFFGMEKLTLNNMVEDPTMVREALAYRMYGAMGVRVPRLRYAEVFLNGEYYGLYLMLEPIDESFLLARGKKGDSLYEGEYGCDLYPDDVDGFDKDGGKKSREDLASFARAAQGSAEELFHLPRAPVDRRRVLGFLAASVLIGDFDGYRQGHNYYLHHEVDRGKWSLVPWGLDRSFTASIGVFDHGGALAVKCFEDQLCRTQYLETLREAADRMEDLDLSALARQLDRTIDHSAKTDARKPYKVLEMRVAHRALEKFLRDRPAEVRKALESVEQQERARSCRPLTAEGGSFLLCDSPMSWEKAAADCVAQGGVLAKIDSRKQSKLIHQAAQKIRKSRWWIGFNDRRMEDDFRWVDLSPVTFAYWGKGEPDNFVCNQDCVALSEQETGHWHDNHCAHRLPFVCRVDQSPRRASMAWGSLAGSGEYAE